jgi:hypothetical protein
MECGSRHAPGISALIDGKRHQITSFYLRFRRRNRSDGRVSASSTPAIKLQARLIEVCAGLSGIRFPD